jgi:DNA repair exonuclease SbcCD nuclease subunit
LGYLIYVQDEQIKINEDITFTGIGEYGQTIATKIEESLRNNPLDKSKFNILALHGYLQGQISDTIYDITGYQLASMGFNYIALGHYHKVWMERENNIYCPGSTEQTSINDWGKPDKDGFFKKSGYFSVKLAINNETENWGLKVERKEFNVRPKGRFTFTFDDSISVEDTLNLANDFVEKHDLKDAIIRFDFIGEVPIGKKSLLNFNNLPAIKKSKALHIIVNQQVSNIVLKNSKVGISSIEALKSLLETTYGFKKSATPKWSELVTETVKILGQKTISSDEVDEIQSIYNLISEVTAKISDTEMTRVTKKIGKTDTKTKETPQKNISIEKSTKSNKSKQSNLSKYIQGEE